LSNLAEFNAAVIKRAEELGFSVTRLGSPHTYAIKKGEKTVRIRGAASSLDCMNGIKTCCSKTASYDLMNSLGVPNPGYTLIKSKRQLQQEFIKAKGPLVLKPSDREVGKGVTTHITTYEDLLSAYDKAIRVSQNIIIQPHVFGREFRFTLLGKKVAFVIEREGELGKPLNLALGNKRTDVTEDVDFCSEICQTCESLAQTLGMHTVGIDVVSKSLNEGPYWILELNSMPILYPQRADLYLQSLFHEH
jgi:glutathione synthase/RimK-type ligase-like ATP-grasp enzyme